ncbi:hypothetical protein [Herbidospora cretacea]|uniref:hypothetical protein n=1 Tax=Herbidospora cretacea TaxID=28444 RepID=UPI0004C38735|nr:hypothetical protein [Herbidospora cretacea]
MSTPLIIGLAATLLAPSDLPAKLVKNPLYKAGRLPAAACKEPALRKNDAASAKRYLTTVFSCLDRTWGTYAKKKGLPYKRPTVHVMTVPGKKDVCGTDWQHDYIANLCGTTIGIMLTEHMLKKPDPLALMDMAAGMAGHVFLDRVGIGDATIGQIPTITDAEKEEVNRRELLQRDCMSGVFIGSVWKSLKRPAKDWSALLKYRERTGDDYVGGPRLRGDSESIVYWMKRGYTRRDPGACNTWTASARQIR